MSTDAEENERHSRDCNPCPSNLAHADPPSHSPRSRHVVYCLAGGRGRAVHRSGAQENLCHSDAHSKTATEEKRINREEEIADTITKSVKEIFPHAGTRIAGTFGRAFAEKEENSGGRARGAIALAHHLAASKD